MKPLGILFLGYIAIFYPAVGQDLQWASDLKLYKSEVNIIDEYAPTSKVQYAQSSGNVTSESSESHVNTKLNKYFVAKFQDRSKCNKIYLVGDNPQSWGIHLLLKGQNNELFIENPEQSTKQLSWGTVNSIIIETTDFEIEQILVFPFTANASSSQDLRAVGMFRDLDMNNTKVSQATTAVPVTATTIEAAVNAPSNQIKEARITDQNDFKPVFFSPKEKLSRVINSPYQEAKPIISPDGQCLYFVRKNSPTNTNGRKDDHDIYYAELINGSWSNSRNIGTPLNDKYANGVCSVSPDGNSLLVLNAYLPKKRVYDGVSISKRIKGGWSEPQEQKIKGYHNLCGYQDYYMSITGDLMLLALHMEESFGDQDLYISFKEGENEWSKPINLGPDINTAMVEFSPFLSVDNHTLYFASTGHKGYGESDIFYSHRLDDTWKNWSKPENLGSEVNTKGSDSYFTISPTTDYAYFISKGSSARSAIYKTNDQDVYRISIKENLQKDPLIIVSGRVLNTIDETPVSASVQYNDITPGKNIAQTFTDPISGSYTFTVPVGQKLNVEAKADGFFPMQLHEDFSKIEKYTVIKKDIYLKPFAVGQTFQLQNLFFVQSKAEMLPESLPELESLIKLLTDKPNLVVELGGHTDNQGLAAANVRLSKERADAVRDYLIEQGISGKRLKTIGYGPKNPVASNIDPASRRLNRRVEIKILKF